MTVPVNDSKFALLSIETACTDVKVFFDKVTAYTLNIYFKACLKYKILKINIKHRVIITCKPIMQKSIPIIEIKNLLEFFISLMFSGPYSDVPEVSQKNE